MSISGISVIKDSNYVVCYIDVFSEELKELIRQELTFICHGKQEVEEYNLSCHSYKNTVAAFMNRYAKKPAKTKKGMIGEFIAHLIITKELSNLQPITVLFNKEELSIKKGFDLTYVEKDKTSIWYGEVKSGEVSGTDSLESKNKALLNNSKNEILSFLSGKRSHLWNSVINDVGLTLAAKDRKVVKDLLDNDIKHISDGTDIKKNAVLISVLFHDTNKKLSTEHIKELVSEIVDASIFSNVILFSIQKSTYTKIENFLIEEAKE